MDLKTCSSGSMLQSGLRFLTRRALILWLLLGFILMAPNFAKAVDNVTGTNLLNPDWRPGLADTGQVTGNIDEKGSQVNANQPSGGVSTGASSGANFNDLMKDPQGNPINTTQTKTSSYSSSYGSGTGNSSGENSSAGSGVHIQMTDTSVDIPVTPQADNNKKAKFSMIATLTCMYLFFPLASFIRNIMMGFLNFLGVPEEKISSKVGETLSNVSQVIGGGVRNAGNTVFKGGTTGGGGPNGPQAPKVNPIGGGVVQVPTGGMQGGLSNAGSAGGPVTKGGGSISGGPVSTASVSGEGPSLGSGTSVSGDKSSGVAQGVKVSGIEGSGNLARESFRRNSVGSAAAVALSGESDGAFPGVGITVPSLSAESAGLSPGVQVADNEGPGSPAGVLSGENPLPPVATREIDGAGQNPWDVPGPSRLNHDMIAVDEKSRSIYNGISRVTSVADGFIPGAGKMTAAAMANIATVPLAVREISNGIKQFRHEGGMSFRDAVKAYTKSNNAFVGAAKIAGGIAGSAFGAGPQAPVVTGMAAQGVVWTGQNTIKVGRYIGKQIDLLLKS